MGQPITLIARPSSTPGIMRYETNRALSGMGHERYSSLADVKADRPVDELARRLLEHGGVDSIHINGNIITVRLAGGSTGAGLDEVIGGLYTFYGPQTASTEVNPEAVDQPDAVDAPVETHGESAAVTGDEAPTASGGSAISNLTDEEADSTEDIPPSPAGEAPETEPEAEGEAAEQVGEPEAEADEPAEVEQAEAPASESANAPAAEPEQAGEPEAEAEQAAAPADEASSASEADTAEGDKGGEDDATEPVDEVPDPAPTSTPEPGLAESADDAVAVEAAAPVTPDTDEN